MDLITLGILEDNSSLRINIERYFRLTNRFEILFSESSFYDVNIDVSPEFIFLDVHLNNTNSLEIVDIISKKFPDSILIVITGDTNQSIMIDAFQNGAKAFIYKPFSNEELVKTIDNIILNGSYMPANTATMLINSLSDHNPLKQIKDKYQLTNREGQVIKLIKAGYSYKEISDKLEVSYHTINHHIKKIYMKLGVNSRSELLAKYIINKNYE